jgi:hypothetical protein
MIHWLLDLPWPLLGFVIVAVCVAVGLLGLSVFRGLILPRLGRIGRQNEVTGAVLHGILIIYGLAVALIAIAVWETNAEVAKLVSSEATAIGALYRDATGYPEPTRTQLHQGIKAYTEYVIHEAWPLQRRGKIPEGGVDLMNHILDVLFDFNPQTESQKIIHAETFRAYNNLLQARRLRLEAVEAGLPAPMWAIVLIGGLISLASVLFFEVENLRLQRIMVALLASLMGLLIFLIAIYDHPFRGAHGVSPAPYELIHEHMME